MKKIVALMCISLLFSITACGDGPNEKGMLGTWRLCGSVPEDSPAYDKSSYSLDDAVMGQEYLDHYGFEEIPDSKVKLTKK